MYDWNFKAADFQFNKALELNPNLPLIHVNYSIFLILTRHYEEALYEAKTAVGLDPISRYYNTRLGSAYLAAGDIDKAIEIQQMTISMNPNYFMAYQHLGDAYIAKSMTKEAIDAYQQAADLSGGNPTALFFLASSYFLNGELEKANSILQKLEERSKNEYIPSVFFFSAYLVTGNTDKSFIWLQQAIEDRDSLIPWLSQYQDIGKIPEEPRFKKLMREAGF
jgi:tetratricopeptide (TPR) repeat protein